MSATGRILLIEDDPLVSEVIAAVLEDRYVVTRAPCASSAQALLREGFFDAVLLDCLLPGGGAARVMVEAEGLGVPVVLTSGHMDQMELRSGGARPFLAKPFSVDELLAILERTQAVSRALLPLPPAGSPEPLLDAPCA